jgi:hypothetical protein
MKYTHIYPWQLLTKSCRINLTHKLGNFYDATELQEECTRIFEEFSPANQHGKDHDGGWRAISLVSLGGNPYEDHFAEGKFERTEALKHAPYIRNILDDMVCQTNRVRLMQLRPGENIYWHYDPSESLDGKHARLHIPIFTHTEVQFQISHDDCQWRPGELWYGDFSFPHRLYNGGADSRVHLVMDLVANSQLRSEFPQIFRDGASSRQRVRKACQRACRLYTARRYGFLHIGPYKIELPGDRRKPAQ